MLISYSVIKMSTSVKADIKILEYAIETYSKSFEELKGVENLLFSISFEPIPVSMMKQSSKRVETH